MRMSFPRHPLVFSMKSWLLFLSCLLCCTLHCSNAAYVTIGGQNKTYYISPKNIHMNALDATTYCNDDNLALVSFETAAEWQMVRDYLSTNDYGMELFWSSGKKFLTKWEWSGSGQVISSTAWASGEPNFDRTKPDVCVYFSSSGGWYDDLCSVVNNIGFMCE